MEIQNASLDDVEKLFQRLTEEEKKVFLFNHADETLNDVLNILSELESEDRLQIIQDKGIGGPYDLVEAIYGNEVVKEWLNEELSGKKQSA